MQLDKNFLAKRQQLFLGSRLRRLGEQMQADAILLAHEAGLPVQPGQYPILFALAEGGCMAVGELAVALGVSQPAVTKQVARMARLGTVEIRPAPDRRLRIVALTAAGRRALSDSRENVWPAIETAVAIALQDLQGSLLEQLDALEQRLRDQPLSRHAKSILSDGVTLGSRADAAAIASLMNMAYRGVGAERPGWTTDAAYLAGDRTSEASLLAEMAQNPRGAWLLRRGAHGLEACVWIQPLSGARYYLGSLAVDPRAQDRGLGRGLLAYAENWIRREGGTEVELTVLSTRRELVAWYERRGYAVTTETEPFPYGDERYGRPARDDLHFIILRKALDDVRKVAPRGARPARD